jgi:hypothetical protein
VKLRELHGLRNTDFETGDEVCLRKGCEGYREGVWFIDVQRTKGNLVWVSQRPNGDDGFFVDPANLVLSWNVDDDNVHDTGNGVEYQNTADWPAGN